MSDQVSNPGKILYNKLSEYFKKPEEYGSRNMDFIQVADNFFGGSQETLDAFQSSILNYVVRRLIYMTKALVKSDSENTREEWEREFEEKVLSRLLVPDPLIEPVKGLLWQSIKENRERGEGAKNRVYEKSEEENRPCNVCGRSVSYKKDQSPKASLDHIWPVELGGSTVDDNLVILCDACNTLKCNHIDAFDFHFERSMTVLEKDHPQFEKFFREGRAFSILWHTHGKCIVCNNPVRVDTSKNFSESLIKIDSESDFFHFFNSGFVCPDHQS